MSKEGFAGAAAPEVRTKFLGDIKVSQVAWRRQPEKCLLTFERTPLEDAVRCWFTREKGQANFFQKKSHREQAAPANRQQLLRTAFLGTIGREAAKAKATRQLAPQQPKGWFGSPTAPRLGAFVGFPHQPLEVPPPSSWQIWHWRRALPQPGRAGGAQRPPGKHQPPPQGATESSVQRTPPANPISQADVAQNPLGQPSESKHLRWGSHWSTLPARGRSWKIASGPGQSILLTREELQQLSRGSLGSPSIPEPRSAATVDGGVTSRHLPS